MNATAPIHILVVDDEPEIRSILRRGFEAEGYEVSEAGGRSGLLRCMEQLPVSLITLDLDLGGENGLELAREIRAKRNVPIVLITGKGEPTDRLNGLEEGADDYITKPFHIREVLLRIRAVLRRYELELEVGAAPSNRDEHNERYEFEGRILDVPGRALKAPNGATIELTDAEFDLLVIFLRRPARVLTRDEISSLLKGRSWTPLDRTIDGHVARLRRKIEPDGEAPRLIKSVRGIGYVFTGEVRT